MRSLIVLWALFASAIAESYEKQSYYQYRGPAAPLSSDGMVIDTPEVTHAREVHLAMHAETMERLRKARQEAYDNSETMYVPSMTEVMMPKRQRARTLAPLAEDGRVVDTPEVAEAKAAHLAAHARAASKASDLYEFDIFDGRRNLLYLAPVRLAYNQLNPLAYTGPFAPLGADGRVVDTDEVKRAREAHMKAHVRARALSMPKNVYY